MFLMCVAVSWLVRKLGLSWGGDTCTPVAGVECSPFSACWKRSVCLAKGSVCNGQDLSCPQPGVKPVMANSLRVGMRD